MTPMEEKQIKTTDWLTKGMTKEQIQKIKEDAIADFERETNERYDIAKIIADNFHFNGEKMDDSDFEWAAHCLQMAGYRKQKEGKWVFKVDHGFNDYGDLTVYATAHCGNCGNEYPFNPTIAREFIERPENLTENDDWDIDVEPIKAEVLRRAETNKNLYHFCPNCGAKMKGE